MEANCGYNSTRPSELRHKHSPRYGQLTVATTPASPNEFLEGTPTLVRMGLSLRARGRQKKNVSGRVLEAKDRAWAGLWEFDLFVHETYQDGKPVSYHRVILF